MSKAIESITLAARSTATKAGAVTGILLNVVGVVGGIVGSDIQPLAWIALGCAVLFVATFWELIGRIRQVTVLEASPAAPGSTAWLKANMTAMDERIFGPMDRDANGVILAGGVVWPDGTPGHFTAEQVDPATGAIDAYSITYEPAHGDAAVVRQPAVRRNPDGIVVDRPHIKVEK